MPRQFAALMLIAYFPVTVGAAGPSPLVAPNSDVMLALKVTAALQADPSLKDFALTVDVARGVATVGGEVPSLNCVATIRAAAGNVPGLAETKVTCWVPGGNDPFFDRVREKLDGKPSPKPEVPVAVSDRRVETHAAGFRPTGSTPDYKSSAEAVRAGDSRFSRLALSFDAGVVVVSGSAATHADATALLLRLRQVPGVTRVRRGSIDAAG